VFLYQFDLQHVLYALWETDGTRAHPLLRVEDPEIAAGEEVDVGPMDEEAVDVRSGRPEQRLRARRDAVGSEPAARRSVTRWAGPAAAPATGRARRRSAKRQTQPEILIGDPLEAPSPGGFRATYLEKRFLRA
jgi:hypothetical protein